MRAPNSPRSCVIDAAPGRAIFPAARRGRARLSWRNARWVTGHRRARGADARPAQLGAFDRRVTAPSSRCPRARRGAERRERGVRRRLRRASRALRPRRLSRDAGPRPRGERRQRHLGRVREDPHDGVPRACHLGRRARSHDSLPRVQGCGRGWHAPPSSRGRSRRARPRRRRPRATRARRPLRPRAERLDRPRRRGRSILAKSASPATSTSTTSSSDASRISGASTRAPARRPRPRPRRVPAPVLVPDRVLEPSPRPPPVAICTPTDRVRARRRRAAPPITSRPRGGDGERLAGWGSGALVPRGPLRERPEDALARADVVALHHLRFARERDPHSRGGVRARRARDGPRGSPRRRHGDARDARRAIGELRRFFSSTRVEPAADATEGIEDSVRVRRGKPRGAGGDPVDLVAPAPRTISAGSDSARGTRGRWS